MLWVEKYRPESFEEIVGNSETISSIEAEVKSGNMNHMQFLGPPGIGKTTTAGVIKNHLYGPGSSSQFMELNASDARGIDDIRNQVKRFSSKKSLSGKHKLILLDEADSLTKDAQQALRRIMEKHHETCRFILTGNEEGGFIDAINSRCSNYYFEPISPEESFKALASVAEQEGLDYSDEILRKLASIKRGDLRSQLIKLQELSNKDDVTVDDVISGEDYTKLMNAIVSKQFMLAKKIANRDNLLNLFHYLMDRDDVPGRVKAEVSIAYSKYMWRMGKSPDTQIHVNALVAELIKTLSKHIDNG